MDRQQTLDIMTKRNQCQQYKTNSTEQKSTDIPYQ